MSQNGFKFTQRAEAFVEKGPLRKSIQALDLGGFFSLECRDVEGNLKWRDVAKNAVVNAALNDILNTYFRNGITVDGWAVGLITGPGPTLAATDTHASHPGWTENTSYTESTRPLWAPDAATAQQLVNPSFIDFNMNASVTVSGLFIVGGTIGGGATDADTKGSTNSAPVLWSTALFNGGDQILNNLDVLRVSYTLNAQAA